MNWADRLIARITRRAPDDVIGGAERPYLLRWFLLPRNRMFNVYLHEFRRSDDDRALHDHPWLFNASLLLRGEYVEHTIRAGGIKLRKNLRAGNLKVRVGPSPHRLELLTISDFVDTQPGNVTPVPCWTLFITGPWVRQWGFHCPDAGWVHRKEFSAEHDDGAVGRGCSQ